MASDFEYILDYSGIIGPKKDLYIDKFSAYARCFSNAQRDKEADKLRRWINNEFYEIYKRCFLRAAGDKNLPDTIGMFLNFGYMDPAFLRDEMVDDIYDLYTRLGAICDSNVYTIFTWLLEVYRGEKEPSKNEFDLDFHAFLTKSARDGKIKVADIDKLASKPEERVAYEIDNMFRTLNRLTYGSITRFSAILSDDDVVKSPLNMLIDKRRVGEALSKVKAIDYSAFYRPLYSHILRGNLSHEVIVSEIIPDIILMPNVGSKAMMWQESASVHNDTPARFIFPIFSMQDIDDMMIRLTASYRWEMCKRINGVKWNDISQHSLTSDYVDYLQFYKTNQQLSAEARENVKSALAKAGNGFKEVFLEDYYNWIKYESSGGYRLNKCARRIMFTYCPFSRDIRDKLRDNPVYAEAINRHDASNYKSYKRLRSLYDTYEKKGGVITTELNGNIEYYKL